MKKLRKGVTLVEVMLAGSLLAFVCLFVMEALLVAARIVHDDSGMVLAADGYALDAVWTVFNGTCGAWPLSTTIQNKAYDIPSNDVPVLCHAAWPAARAYLTVTNAAVGEGTLMAGGKMISVNVVWGPAGDRRQLWGDPAKPLEADVKRVYEQNNPRWIFRAADIDRGEAELN